MNNRIITKEMLGKEASWYDKKTFIASVMFKDFPKTLLDAFNDLIEEEDLEEGYLCCEYWLPEDETDTENFVYSFIFEHDSISVNDFFRKPLYNEIIKKLALGG